MTGGSWWFVSQWYVLYTMADKYNEFDLPKQYNCASKNWRSTDIKNTKRIWTQLKCMGNHFDHTGLDVCGLIYIFLNVFNNFKHTYCLAWAAMLCLVAIFIMSLTAYHFCNLPCLLWSFLSISSNPSDGRSASSYDNSYAALYTFSKLFGTLAWTRAGVLCGRARWKKRL